MSDSKLKVVASIVMFAVITSALSVFATGIANACTYSPYDLNKDGLVDMKDVLILAPAWQSRAGDANFNPCCDFNKDGIINIRDAGLLVIHWTWLLKARVYVMPHTLNLKSHGSWITAVILLPAKVNASDIEFSSIKLNDTIVASHGAHVCKSSNGLAVKFSREEVITLVRQSLNSEISADCEKSTHVTLTVTGTLTSGLRFSGSDMIRVIQCHKCGH
jgi:hypothetical protein